MANKKQPEPTPEEKAVKEKAEELAELYPLNPGGVSADIDPPLEPALPVVIEQDASRNPGGVRNPNN